MISAPETRHSRRAAVFGWPWYPFVAAVYPLWSIYAGNIGQVSAVSAATATGVVLVVIGVLLWVATRLSKSRHVGALVLTLAILAFYAYGAVHDLAVRLAIDPPVSPWLSALFEPFTSDWVLSAVVFGVCVLLVFMIVRRVAPGSARVTGACNFAAATLAAIMLVRLGIGGWQQHSLRLESKLDGVTAGNKVSVLGYNPDIYYIIVDGYARADVLRKFYDFDNTGFIRGLETRGFSVNDSSRSNYYWTFLSLASSLNYDYLQDIAAPLFANPEGATYRDGFEQVARLAQDNRAAHFLRARGYRFVHIQSSAPPTVTNPFADEQVTCKGGLFDDEYFRTLAEVTWLRAAGSLASADLAECHKMRLRSLGDQARRPGPKFVFAHFLPPHHPYLFDRNGNVLKHVTVSNQFDFQAQLWEDKHGYLEQVMYTNRTVLEVVDRILAESERPPIIIVQSDHGPNLLKGIPRENARALRFANFAAYYLPGAPAGSLPRDCAPVNQFRYLFNQYFDAGLTILPNRNFFSSYGAPLRMQEVAVLSPIGKES